MAKHNYIYAKQVKKCNKCGKDIYFTKNRCGKWFTVDVLHDTSGNGPTAHYYESGIGAHGNMTPWHQCSVMLPESYPDNRNWVDAETQAFNAKITQLVMEGKTDELKAVLEEYSKSKQVA